MKLTKDLITRDYELTYLLAGDLLDADVARIKKEVTELVEKYQGKLVKEDNWGRKHMAYKIREAGKTYEEAVYVHCVVSFPVTAVQKFDQELTLSRDIIRHLLVLAEDGEVVAKVVNE